MLDGMMMFRTVSDVKPEPPESTVNGIRTELIVRLGCVSECSDLLNDLLDNDFKIKITLDCTEGNIEDNKYQKIKDQIDDTDSVRVSAQHKDL